MIGPPKNTLPYTPGPVTRPPVTPRPPVVDGNDNDRGGTDSGRTNPPYRTPSPPTHDTTPCDGGIDAVTVIRKEVFIFKGAVSF